MLKRSLLEFGNTTRRLGLAGGIPLLVLIVIYGLAVISRYDSAECSILGSEGGDIDGLPGGARGYGQLVSGLFTASLFFNAASSSSELNPWLRRASSGTAVVLGGVAIGYLLVGTLSGNCPGTGGGESLVSEVDVFSWAVGLLVLGTSVTTQLPRSDTVEGSGTPGWFFDQVGFLNLLIDVVRWFFGTRPHHHLLPVPLPPRVRC